MSEFCMPGGSAPLVGLLAAHDMPFRRFPAAAAIAGCGPPSNVAAARLASERWRHRCLPAASHRRLPHTAIPLSWRPAAGLHSGVLVFFLISHFWAAASGASAAGASDRSRLRMTASLPSANLREAAMTVVCRRFALFHPLLVSDSLLSSRDSCCDLHEAHCCEALPCGPGQALDAAQPPPRHTRNHTLLMRIAAVGASRLVARSFRTSSFVRLVVGDIIALPETV